MGQTLRPQNVLFSNHLQKIWCFSLAHGARGPFYFAHMDRMIRCNRPKNFGLSEAARSTCPEKSNPEMEDRLTKAMAKRAQQDTELWGTAEPEEKDTTSLLNKK